MGNFAYVVTFGVTPNVATPNCPWSTSFSIIVQGYIQLSILSSVYVHGSVTTVKKGDKVIKDTRSLET